MRKYYKFDSLEELMIYSKYCWTCNQNCKISNLSQRTFYSLDYEIMKLKIYENNLNITLKYKKHDYNIRLVCDKNICIFNGDLNLDKIELFIDSNCPNCNSKFESEFIKINLKNNIIENFVSKTQTIDFVDFYLHFNFTDQTVISNDNIQFDCLFHYDFSDLDKTKIFDIKNFFIER